jgi:hypothetical protein
MKSSVLAVLFAATLCLLAGPLQALEPTDDDMARYHQEIANLENEIVRDFSGFLQPESSPGIPQTPIPMSKHFKVKKKSSSLTRAIRRAKMELKEKVDDWISSLSNEGYILVEKPEPATRLDHEWGLDFPKFYVRLKLDLTVYCVKP